MKNNFVKREDLVVGKAYYLFDDLNNDAEIGEFHSRDEEIDRTYFIPVKGNRFYTHKGKIEFTFFGSPFREVE